MLVTFPHMGTLSIVLNALFTSLGCRVVVPPPISKRTLEIGTKLSPETVCLPFKMTLGNFVEALDEGADTIVTCGGIGPCRLGYYAEIQQAILKQLGYSFQMVVIEPDLLSAYKSLRQVAPRASWLTVWSAFRLAGAKMNGLDALARHTQSVRPREQEAGTSDVLLKLAVQRIDDASTVEEVKAVTAGFLRKVGQIACRPDYTPLKVGLVGEIYVMLEPFINQDLERRLGSMGVEVDKTMYLSDYVRTHLLRRRECLKLAKALSQLAKPYLGHYVGGHGLKSVANTVLKAQEGYDGMIQAYPFTCMPEVIAKNILPKVSQDLDFPVLTLAYDEQTGEAGTVTRLEAFVDLLRYRRTKSAMRYV